MGNKAIYERFAWFDSKVRSGKYYSPAKDEHTERMVDPYHLLNYMGTWHLIAYCHVREDIRDLS